MATIMIGSAKHDENGKFVNGTAGDGRQTSSVNDTVGEVSMQKMYTASKGWYILRPKSVAHAMAIAESMTAACNNINIGYDQYNRLGVVEKGIDTKEKTECDCSSLVRQVVKEATGKDPGNFTTANEASKLEATGLFEKRIAYVSQDKTPVYDGDVLVTKTKGHTVVVTSGNPRTATVEPTTSNTTSSASAIEGGDIVAIAKGATYYNSTKAPGEWITNKNWVVKKVSGSRVVVDKSEDGKDSINSPFDAKHLTVVKKTAATKPTTSTTTSTSEAVEYYPKYTGTSYKINEVFKAIGVSEKYTGVWSNRIPVASANGVKSYTGKYEQNKMLINLAKTGKLKKVK